MVKVHVLFILMWNSSDTRAPTVYTLTVNNEGGMHQDNTSDTRAPTVYTLTVNNEGRMDQDPTHTTEWFPPSF